MMNGGTDKALRFLSEKTRQGPRIALAIPLVLLILFRYSLSRGADDERLRK
jgi:hypothetical protein